jgi:excisionase family DNA binding protein
VPTRKPRKLVLRSPLAKGSEILDVHMTAELLTVSTDTVYDLFKKGDLPARKVGRKWLTTRSAVLRWIEHSSEQDTLARAFERGDANALAAALTNGQVQVRKRG